MIYMEFVERDRWVPIEVFRHLGNQQSSWAEGSVDRMVLQLGRTLRFGPRPSYLCLWDIPDIGRLDAWEEYFQSPAAFENRRSQAMHRSINIDRAGLYDILHRANSAEASVYIVEYCEPLKVEDSEIQQIFSDRSTRHRELQLIFLLRRLGHLGPDPALMSIWGAPTYIAAEPLLREASWDKVQLVDVGVYRSFGAETL